MSVDPKKLVVLPANSEDKKGRAVLIPIVLKSTGTTIWAKAALMQGKKEEGRKVESVLRRALDEVEQERKTPETTEDEGGRVQVSLDVFAGFADSAEKARMVQLKGA